MLSLTRSGRQLAGPTAVALQWDRKVRETTIARVSCRGEARWLVLKNRRKYSRVPLGSRCWCETDGITLYARLVDVSEGGVFLRTFAPLQRGSLARLRFELNGGGIQVSADAVVVWVRESELDPRAPPGMGMEFRTLDETSALAVRRFVAEALEQPSAAGNS